MGLFNEHSSTTKTDSSSTQGPSGPQGIGYKLDANGNFDIENKKLTNVKNGDMNKDVMTKSQIEGYVSNKTQYLDGVLPAKVTNNKAVIYSPSGGVHSNGLYLKDEYGQEVHFYNEDQDDNQIRLYIPNLKNNDSYGGRLKSTIVVTSIDQTIEGKKVFHDIEVPNPTIDGHASNKAYVDNEISNAIDNFNYVEKSGDTMIGPLIVPKDNYPVQGDLNKVISYETQREIFLSKKEETPMETDLNMNNHHISNLKLPSNPDHACNKDYLDTELNHKVNRNELRDYIKTDGTNAMTGDLNLNNKKIINVAEPYLSHDVVNKDYVTKVINHLPTMFVDRLGNSSMLGNLNMNNKRINNLQNPIQSHDAVTLSYLSDMFLDRMGFSKMLGNIDMNKKKIINVIEPVDDLDVSNKLYIDNQIIKSNIKPNNIQKNVFKYLMETPDEFSSEYNIKVNDFITLNESPHNYNKKALSITPLKDDIGNYRFRLGLQGSQLENNKEYTLIIELYNKDYITWERQLTYVNGFGILVESYNTQKFQHTYGENSVIYYSKTIIQLKRTNVSPPIQIYITYHYDNHGGDLNTYPKEFKNQNFILAYGIKGLSHHISSEVYDYNKAYEIEQNTMKMLIPLDMNNKKILNIPNTSSINLFGKIINNYFTLSSTQESNINIGPFFIEHIILYTSNKFRSQQDTMSINTGKISKLTINYPSTPGNTIIQINKYYDRISTIRMLIASNINFRIIYRVFY